jgi:hypothetical protein
LSETSENRDFSPVRAHKRGENYEDLPLFLQNKANLPDAQMNVHFCMIRDYGDFAGLRLRKNKAKTNPISKHLAPCATNIQLEQIFAGACTIRTDSRGR